MLRGISELSQDEETKMPVGMGRFIHLCEKGKSNRRWSISFVWNLSHFPINENVSPFEDPRSIYTNQDASGQFYHSLPIKYISPAPTCSVTSVLRKSVNLLVRVVKRQCQGL